MATGKRNREVAGELFVSVRTVESNLTRIYSKLGVRSRGELAARGNLATDDRGVLRPSRRRAG